MTGQKSHQPLLNEMLLLSRFSGGNPVPFGPSEKATGGNGLIGRDPNLTQLVPLSLYNIFYNNFKIIIL